MVDYLATYQFAKEDIMMHTTTTMPPSQPTRDNDALTRAAQLTLGDNNALTRAAQLTLGDNNALTRAAQLTLGENNALTRAAQLTLGENALSEGARRMSEELGGVSLRDGLERCHPASRRGMADGVSAATPPGALPLVVPTSSASDEALEILKKCADAAEKVHGTGKYARTS
ncbi:hypothetical protein [Sorangium sp. So ce426]|uniref:hypothetical protein n=1 Tax=Sorangium sp. So ce426 TaxID=3133312 RepID=UPI003F5C1FFA